MSKTITTSPVKDGESETLGAEAVESIRRRLNIALKGKEDVIEMVLVCLLSRGHLLLEDKPGLGKTTLAKALAEAVGGDFARAQCTPDLLPSDITGFNIFNDHDHDDDHDDETAARAQQDPSTEKNVS